MIVFMLMMVHVTLSMNVNERRIAGFAQPVACEIPELWLIKWLGRPFPSPIKCRRHALKCDIPDIFTWIDWKLKHDSVSRCEC